MAEKFPYLAHTNENVAPIGLGGFSSGGGGGMSGDMEARVKALEDKFERIDDKLDMILLDLTSMKETVATKDSVSAISERVAKLETAVSMLPGTMQLILFVIAVLGIAGLAKYFAP